MADDLCKAVGCSFLILPYCWWLVLAIILYVRALAYFDWQNSAFTLLQINAMWNLEKEWTNDLIQSISIQDEPCSGGNFLFELVWLGAKAWKKRYKVDVMSAPAVLMRKIGVKYICYNQGSGLTPFGYSDKLELEENESCGSATTITCNSANPANTLCFKDQFKTKKCPVTDLKVVSPDKKTQMEVAQSALTKESANFYEFVQIDSSNWLAWSRTTDHQPIVSVKGSVGGKPCIDPKSVRALDKG